MPGVFEHDFSRFNGGACRLFYARTFVNDLPYYMSQCRCGYVSHLVAVCDGRDPGADHVDLGADHVGLGAGHVGRAIIATRAIAGREEEPHRRHPHDAAAAFAFVYRLLDRSHHAASQGVQTGVARRAQGEQLRNIHEPCVCFLIAAIFRG